MEYCPGRGGSLARHLPSVRRCILYKHLYNFRMEQPPILKPIDFCGSALDDLRSFPATAKREAGVQLDRVQRGLDPDDWKPMKIVGQGTKEIRIKDQDGAFRVIYVAKFEDAVYVLHCFQKTSQRTEQPDINLAKMRYKALIKDY